MALERTKSFSSLPEIFPMNNYLYYANTLEQLPELFNEELKSFTELKIKPSLVIHLSNLTQNLKLIIHQFNIHVINLDFSKHFLRELDELIERFLVDKLQRTIDSIRDCLYDYEEENEHIATIQDEDTQHVAIAQPQNEDLKLLQNFIMSTLKGQTIQLNVFKNFLMGLVISK